MGRAADYGHRCGDYSAQTEVDEAGTVTCADCGAELARVRPEREARHRPVAAETPSRPPETRADKPHQGSAAEPLRETHSQGELFRR